MIAARPAAASVRRRSERSELILGDLLHDLNELGELLGKEIERENWLDAFLLAAGMNQVVEDYLHRDLGSLAKVAANLRDMRGVGTAAGQSLDRLRSLALAARASLPAERRVANWQLKLAELVVDLSCRVASGGDPSRLRAGEQPDWRQILGRVEEQPQQLKQEVLRLPSCFRSLDLEPADVGRLVDDVAARWPDRHRPMLVVGLRTSGSYLGPLHIAYLRRSGFERVTLMTLRPGQDLLAGDVGVLARAARQDSLAIVVDDPPSSGGSVAAAAAVLKEVGFPSSNVALSLPLMGSAADLPEPLRRFQAVLLDRRDWAIEERLEPAAVHVALEQMLDGRMGVESVSRQPVPSTKDPREEGTKRRHLRALFAVQLRDPAGTARSGLIYVKGTGLGYFGGHSLAVAESLRVHLPGLYGVEGGLLFRQWQPESHRVDAATTSVESLAESIAEYTVNRSHTLAVSRDLSVRMLGRQAVWQRVADLLSEPFGRLRLLLRPHLHLLARRLLMVRGASVVDGSMALRQWFTTPADGVVKVDYDELAFSNEDIYSYDHLYDLGSAASSLRTEFGPDAADAVREAYERVVGGRVDQERWFLYQLMSARLLRRTLRSNLAATLPVAPPHVLDLLDAVESTLEGVQRDYMRERYLRDVAPAQSGPLCAIDIDGTLETAPLGFTSIGVAGAVALRALARHGFRAVLASGRSLNEIRSRCDAYSLPGGVAEYGAVIYISAGGEVIEMVDKANRARLERLRSVLANREDVWLDRRYRLAIRAYTLDRRGRRRGLEPETVRSLLAAAGVDRDVVAIPGWSQTDFVAASITKADGLRVAAGRLGTSGESLFQLAVGDSASDMSMLRLARLGCVPADGSTDLHAPGVEVMSRCGQAGLAQAVGRLLGHEPGGCGGCTPPDHGSNASVLLGLIAAYDDRGWRRFSRVAKVIWRLRHT